MIKHLAIAFLLLANLITDAHHQRPPTLKESRNGSPQTDGDGDRAAARQTTPGAGAYTEDGRAVLRAAARALRRVRTVSYHASYQGAGAFATRNPVVVGEIRMSKLPAGDPLRARLAARGEFYAPGSDKPLFFHTAFDGRTIRRLAPKDKALTEKVIADTNPNERNLSFVTSFFGLPYGLMMFDYLLDEPLAAQLKASVADYEGRAVVGGVLCHVIYVEYDDALGSKRRQRWFIGKTDDLPRKMEEMEDDDKGRSGARVLELSDLVVNVPYKQSDFSVRAPRGYAVKPYVEVQRPALLAAGEAAPEWRLTDAEGRVHSLSEYRGRVVVLDFWATWCGPCRKLMPELQRLHEKYRGRGVVVLGVSGWEDVNDVDAAAYVKEKGYSYGLLLKGEQIAGAYHVTLLPTIYVIGVDGRIVHGATGMDEDLDAVIEKCLGARVQ
jgi:thiol-disulfide isomerase/thioredoxin